MRITRVWIVTKPSTISVLEDICFETNLRWGLCHQYRGGLDPDDIVGIFDNRPAAELEAKWLLAQERINHA